MKKLIFTSASILITTFSFAQQVTQQELQEFQLQHPTVLFFVQENYDELSEKQKLALAGRVIVYTNELSTQDLETWNVSKQIINENLVRSSSSQIVKNWLAYNTEIVVVSQDYFDSLDEETKQQLLENHVLISRTAVLTEEDILNYHY